MPGIDLHAHLAPQLGPPRVDPDDMPAGVEHRATDGRLVVDGHAVGPAELYQPDALRDWLDRRELDAATVSVPPPFFRQHLDAHAAAAYVDAVNDGLAAACAPQGGLMPLAYLPFDHPDVALDEARRRQNERSWAGWVASAGGGSRDLADDDFGELWEMLERDGRLLFLHPGTSPDERLRTRYLTNLLGNPVETAVAAAQLVLGDVLGRHPGLRILLAHGGGCVPGVVGRWERGVATERPGLEPLTRPPSAAVRDLYADCLAHDAAALDHAVDAFGDRHLVLGSDWPFPMGHDDPAALCAHRGDDFVARVRVDNARAALGPALD